MKYTIIKIIFHVLLLSSTSAVFGQYNWKLSKDKDGIRVYESETKNSKFKSIKVECTLQGTYDKLISILSNVSRHNEWVYNAKSSSIIKKNSPQDF